MLGPYESTPSLSSSSRRIGLPISADPISSSRWRTDRQATRSVRPVDVVEHRRDRSQQTGRQDLLVAGVTLLLSASTAAFTATKSGEPAFGAAAFAVLGVAAAGLVWRRRFPIAALVVASVAAAVYGAFDWPDPLLPFGVFLALATVFEHSSATAKWTAWGVLTLASVIGTAWITDSDALDWWTAALVVVGSPLIGDYLRTRKRLLEEATARIHRLEVERLVELDHARAAERARVARELHDVVAHHVTMLIVQAEAAASRAEMAGSQSQSTFDELARGGRVAMSELRQMLGALRSEDDSLLTAPRPTITDLDALLTDITASGVTVNLSVSGPVDSLPAAVDLATYRVVQEGLTNVVKHAPRSPAEVTISSTGDGITVLVLNSPAPENRAAEEKGGEGVGLIGLCERVELLGGTVSARPGPLGGFRLEAHLPLDAA